ncbi:MAG TPA: hypothetical protein VFX05_04770 [Casimicrobiaceae bacterium]|nr:hypothetical protein [Casimicrobiaceae bacterium]
MHSRRREGGWAFVVLLAALAIVAFLGRGPVMQWLGRTMDSAAAGSTAARASAAPAVANDAAATGRSAVERARSVEGFVLRQADDASKRVDERAR